MAINEEYWCQCKWAKDVSLKTRLEKTFKLCFEKIKCYHDINGIHNSKTRHVTHLFYFTFEIVMLQSVIEPIFRGKNSFQAHGCIITRAMCPCRVSALTTDLSVTLIPTPVGLS